MIELAPAFGVLAAMAGVANTIPYIRDTVRGSTRPQRGTWLIWSTLAVVAFCSQLADGASWSLPMVGAQVVLTALIFCLAIPRGEGGMSPPEVAMIALAAGGLAGWLIADEPLLAIGCVVAADLIGAALMLPKTWRDPHSETLVSFVLASVGGALAAAAVGSGDVSLLLYPVYFALVNAAIALVIHGRRQAGLRLPGGVRTAHTVAGR
jgi:hypothetical protein